MKKLILFLMALLLIQCSKPSLSILQVSFQFNNAKGDVEPSYQLAIWLEDVDENYVSTLLLSEYLSYGGYNDTTICPRWNSKADWDNAPIDAYDAVTCPTPSVGENLIEFALDTLNIESGEYLLCVQAHLIEDYNITFKNKINIGTAGTSTSDAIFDPAVYKGTETVLANVTTQIVKVTK